MIFWVIFFVLLFWVNRIVVFIPITDAHPNIPWKWTNDIIVNLGATNRLMRDSNMWIFKVFWYLFILSSWDVFIKVIHISKCLLKISAEIESIKQLKLFKQLFIYLFVAVPPRHENHNLMNQPISLLNFVSHEFTFTLSFGVFVLKFAPEWSWTPQPGDYCKQEIWGWNFL